ncbi:MAG TPA: ThuA domain-containing protein [Thermogutta sp.]|nr:ThuA domain-containing protein [Thermogutta sp.]HPU08061.1 ThuA domain-containing protein [Thermogutta sp.]HQF13396.1 ThuA domain-containing protein [Thermogutta sp.]
MGSRFSTRKSRQSGLCWGTALRVAAIALVLVGWVLADPTGTAVAEALNPPAFSTIDVLPEGERTWLRDAVAYQISMGRSLDMAVREIKALKSFPEQWSEPQLAALVGAMYQRLTAPPQRPSRRPRALALIGDRYHDPAYIRPPLEEAMEKAGVAVAFLYDVRQLVPQVVFQYDLLVILRDGMLWPDPQPNGSFGKPVFWLTEEQEMTVASFVWAGGGFLALHNATALKALNETESLYLRVLGASYAGHGPAQEGYYVRVLNGSHPVTAGVHDYFVEDERHWPRLYVSDALVLLESASGEETSLHGFVRTFGLGRVCYLANGHNRRVLESDVMQRILRNAARWCLEPRLDVVENLER